MLNRRNALGALAAFSAPFLTVATAQEAPSREAEFWSRPRRLKLQHVSGEKLNIVYWADGEIVRNNYETASIFLRDRAANRAVYMHPALLDILYGVQGWLDYFEVHSPIIVTSGYRDPARNARIEGAARNSHHIKGEACDFTIPGISTRQIASFGQWMGGGGVGWYPSRGFIHLDCGNIRAWRG